jgi:hypothetical protein
MIDLCGVNADLDIAERSSPKSNGAGKLPKDIDSFVD